MNSASNEKQKSFKMPLINLALIALLIILAAWPLLVLPDAEFAGADGEAEVAITEIRQDYEPWFEPLLEPKSGEIESLLFTLQAAVGSGVFFFGLGFMVGRKRKEVIQP